MARPPGLEPGTAGLEIREPAPTEASEPRFEADSEVPPADTPALGSTSDSKSDPDIAALIAAWPTLPASIQAAIKALVQVGEQTEEPDA